MTMAEPVTKNLMYLFIGLRQAFTVATSLPVTGNLKLELVCSCQAINIKRLWLFDHYFKFYKHFNI